MAVLPVPGNRAVRPGRLRRACQLVRVTAAVTGSDRRPVAFLAGRAPNADYSLMRRYARSQDLAAQNTQL
jgi:hypothetical protein